MSFGEPQPDFNALSDPAQAPAGNAVDLDQHPEQLPERQLLKITPGPGADEQYERLAATFRPVFAQIAEGAAHRDRERILPFEQVGLLNRERFGACASRWTAAGTVPACPMSSAC